MKKRIKLWAFFFTMTLFLSACGGNNSVGDTTALAATTDLQVTATTDSSVTLSWTVPGDDGGAGQASAYEIRYSTDPITEVNFAAATLCSNLPTPGATGTTQTFEITGLQASTTYYFALKTADEVPNWSLISNIATVTTTVPAPLGEVHYDGDNTSSVGLGSGGTLIVAARYTTTQFGVFVGEKLSAVKVYNSLGTDTIFTLKVYGAGTTSTPGAELFSQDYTVQPGWNTLPVSPSITIPDDDLWAGYAVTHLAGEYPVGIDDATHLVDSAWISADGGSSWLDFSASLGAINLRLVITSS